MKEVYLISTILFGTSHGPVVEVPMPDWNTCIERTEHVEWYMPMEDGPEMIARTTCIIKTEEVEPDV